MNRFGIETPVDVRYAEKRSMLFDDILEQAKITALVDEYWSISKSF